MKKERGKESREQENRRKDESRIKERGNSSRQGESGRKDESRNLERSKNSWEEEKEIKYYLLRGCLYERKNVPATARSNGCLG